MLVPLSIALLAAAALAIGMGRPFIRFLAAWKMGQIIRAEGPQAHQAKAGTPSMGGWIFLVPALVVTAFLTPITFEVLLVAGVTLGFGAVGWLDDYLIVKKRHNKGLAARQKLVMQFAVAAAFCVGLHFLGRGTSVILPFTGGHGMWDLGFFYYPLLVFILVGTTNAVNLTDGLDGLAAGTTAIALAGLAWALMAYGHFASLGGVLIFVFALIGGLLGFLWYNSHPAQVFMGDTGSLALGGAIAGAAALGKLEFWLIPLGIVFIAETLSVMAQVAYFKRTGGKRLLKMSPLHHHFELSGWKETKVVSRFYLAGAVGALLAVAFL